MNFMRAAAAVAATTVSVSLAAPAPAYPVDCAILLCLAGGWPASAECAHARAVFIARITPWPVEPPLQIWNCPMRASIQRDKAPMERLLEIALRGEGGPWRQSQVENTSELYLAQDRADVDISDPAYDFVRSIHVFQIEYRRHRNRDGDCNTWSTIREGTYGEQGDFAWARSTPARVPSASAFRPGTSCSDYWFRGVFVDWTDYEGTYGFEEVRY
ncbi:hypothetical protein C0V75_20395 [Tabrizicola sp. TH137]|uniref:hypothetical protein n=1 Tax=Tabrizicola sp. TH137 TaxID=2067452 RepID=UPI000C7DFAA5|nr:hypothetical protein [Tabrizicola sp. TH137]PLL10472.1 hypothetical protein C0V75_20395 [Tabrizicola sp. TH137]